MYSGGEYQSEDADFILQSATNRKALDDALATIGFRRKGDHYENPSSRFFIEFPPGPLSIGRDLRIVPAHLKVGSGDLLALSATDSCRDRLAAYYHWNDLQSLETAIAIALRHKVDLRRIQMWSAAEGMETRFNGFRRQLEDRRSKR